MHIITCVDKETGGPAGSLQPFCNLIDNAIEASEKITDGDTERFIKISADCRSGFLYPGGGEYGTTGARSSRTASAGRARAMDKEPTGLGLKLVKADRGRNMTAGWR